MRLPPNPNYLAEIAATREMVLTARAKRGNVSLAVIASECGLHSNLVMRVMSPKPDTGESSYTPTKGTADALRSWAEKNKKAKTIAPEKVQKDLGARIRSAYEVKKARGMNAEEMAMAAGVNRTVFSQVMNGSYTRTLRPTTLKSLNAWTDKALRR